MACHGRVQALSLGWAARLGKPRLGVCFEGKSRARRWQSYKDTVTALQILFGPSPEHKQRFEPNIDLGAKDAEVPRPEITPRPPSLGASHPKVRALRPESPTAATRRGRYGVPVRRFAGFRVCGSIGSWGKLLRYRYRDRYWDRASESLVCTRIGRDRIAIASKPTNWCGVPCSDFKPPPAATRWTRNLYRPGARDPVAPKRSPNFQVGVGGRRRRKPRIRGAWIMHSPQDPAGCATASRIATAHTRLKPGALFCR